MRKEMRRHMKRENRRKALKDALHFLSFGGSRLLSIVIVILSVITVVALIGAIRVADMFGKDGMPWAGPLAVVACLSAVSLVALLTRMDRRSS